MLLQNEERTKIEQLLHRGLVKQYSQTTGNRTALKGSLQFAQHLNHNLVHRERFYVSHTTYDRKHLLHQILYEALLLLQRLNTHPQLHHRIGRLLLDWAEQDRLKAYPALFDRITFNRKTIYYRSAIQIAKMLLLNYHPDVSRGQEGVLALMFDMNQLWERFVYVSLRKHTPEGKPYTLKIPSPSVLRIKVKNGQCARISCLSQPGKPSSSIPNGSAPMATALHRMTCGSCTCI
ncbi:MAG: hypothetical protein RIC19_17995 [Phaeodactylibacter sp.]